MRRLSSIICPPTQRPGIWASLKTGQLSFSHRCYWSNVSWSFKEGGWARRLSWCIIFWGANLNVGGRGSSRAPPSSRAC